MINMFSHMACICLFVFYALPRASYEYIQCGFIPSVSGGSLIFFQLFRCRNLALNRGFFLFFSGRHVLYLGGVWIPLHSYTPYIHTNLYICMPPGVHTPICPHTPLYLCVLEALHVLGVVMGSPLCWDTLPYITPVWGCLPFITPPHSITGSFCIGMFQGYQYVMWAFPFCHEGLGVFSPSVRGIST